MHTWKLNKKTGIWKKQCESGTIEIGAGKNLDFSFYWKDGSLVSSRQRNGKKVLTETQTMAMVDRNIQNLCVNL